MQQLQLQPQQNKIVKRISLHQLVLVQLRKTEDALQKEIVLLQLYKLPVQLINKEMFVLGILISLHVD